MKQPEQAAGRLVVGASGERKSEPRLDLGYHEGSAELEVLGPGRLATSFGENWRRASRPCPNRAGVPDAPCSLRVKISPDAAVTRDLRCRSAPAVDALVGSSGGTRRPVERIPPGRNPSAAECQAG